MDQTAKSLSAIEYCEVFGCDGAALFEYGSWALLPASVPRNQSTPEQNGLRCPSISTSSGYYVAQLPILARTKINGAGKCRLAWIAPDCTALPTFFPKFLKRGPCRGTARRARAGSLLRFEPPIAGYTFRSLASLARRAAVRVLAAASEAFLARAERSSGVIVSKLRLPPFAPIWAIACLSSALDNRFAMARS